VIESRVQPTFLRGLNPSFNLQTKSGTSQTMTKTSGRKSMTVYSGCSVKTISPTRREPAKKRGRPKLDLRPVEHVRFGRGKLLAIRQIDGTHDYMADVRFADGTPRTLLLVQRYWLTDIRPLLPNPPKPRRARVKAVPQMVEVGEQELEAA
jgi:hypothetical protein